METLEALRAELTETTAGLGVINVRAAGTANEGETGLSKTENGRVSWHFLIDASDFPIQISKRTAMTTHNTHLWNEKAEI